MKMNVLSHVLEPEDLKDATADNARLSAVFFHDFTQVPFLMKPHTHPGYKLF